MKNKIALLALALFTGSAFASELNVDTTNTITTITEEETLTIKSTTPETVTNAEELPVSTTYKEKLQENAKKALEYIKSISAQDVKATISNRYFILGTVAVVATAVLARMLYKKCPYWNKKKAAPVKYS